MIAKRIISLMLNKNLSAKQFADELHISPSIVTHLTSGRNNPSLDIILKIKNKFPEVDLDWLLLGTTEIPTFIDEKKNSTEASSPSPQKTEPIELPFKKDWVKENRPSKQIIQPIELENSTEEKSTPKSIKNELIKVILFYENGNFEVFRPY